MINKTQLIEIEKFLEYKLRKRISDKDNKRLIKGTYKHKHSDEIYEGDNFNAYELNNCTALEVYECYIKYFNYTIQSPYEEERFAVKAEWAKEDE